MIVDDAFTQRLRVVYTARQRRPAPQAAAVVVQESGRLQAADEQVVAVKAYVVEMEVVARLRATISLGVEVARLERSADASRLQPEGKTIVVEIKAQNGIEAR